jgi:exonuclease SbcC
LEALEKKLAKFAEELATLGARREAAASALAAAEKALQTCRDTLNPLFGGLPEARGEWDRDAAMYRHKFHNETTAFTALERRVVELSTIIRETEAALVPSHEAFAHAQFDESAKRTAEAAARSAFESVRTQRASLLAGRPAETVEQELAEALRRASENRDLLAAELEKASHHLTSTVEALKGADQALADALDRQTHAAAALDAWLANFTQRIGRAFGRVELAAVLARDEAWIKAERAALDELEGAVRNAQGALAVHQKTLDTHRQNRPTPDDEPTVTAALHALRITFGELGQRRDSTRATLLADDQRLRDNAVLASQLRERRASAEPWLKLNELIGSADGAKFRGIAQRRTLDILLGYANAQLDRLAARYRLERLPESLNLLVVDRDMADERRSVHSLSGGESFLVSLALALALASLTSNRLRIESLFIDEGFGNLDSETLTTAMNALMRLEAQGRKVGVISHVTEMTDAIPVQIRVVKSRGGASHIVVPGVSPMTDAPPGSGASLIQESPQAQTTVAIAEIATQLLGILRREQIAGRPKVSTRALREEIGCALPDFTAARDALHDQVRTEGKSLTLA